MEALLDPLLGVGPGEQFRFGRWVFLRALGLVYLVAFASLWMQVRGLIGEDGILPAGEYLDAVRRSRGEADPAAVPTLFWIRSDDRALLAGCAAGCSLALLLVVGVAPALCALLLWGLYLSFAAVGRVFLSYQWDVLLLEAGVVGALLAPWELLPGGPPPPVPTAALALAWWLLFRLHFESGLGKLESGDRSWRDLTALSHHFRTQPLPTPVGWYAHHLPTWTHRAGTAAVHVLEIGWPFLIFLGGEARAWAAGGLVALQLLIFVTGNYNFFNLLAISLCALLLGDGLWASLLPDAAMELARRAGAPALPPTGVAPPAGGAQGAVAAVGAGALFLVSAGVMWDRHLPGPPAPVIRLLRAIRPFRTVNSYGLFRVMTTEHPEIVVEGSRDGERWEPVAFRFKPGDPGRPPSWVAPHQPRLDWQMWFAALGSWERSRWFQAFLVRLLEGSEPVVDLLESTPFDEPPRYLRAVLYEYRFTTPGERRRTGRWWKRERLGPYGPVLDRRSGSVGPGVGTGRLR